MTRVNLEDKYVIDTWWSPTICIDTQKKDV